MINNIFEIVCLVVCGLHFFLSFIIPIFQGKKIAKICEKCLSPYTDEKHECNPVVSEVVSIVTDYLVSKNISFEEFVEAFNRSIVK